MNISIIVHDPERAHRRRRATQGAWFGFFVDAFDIYLPTIALVPALIYFTDGFDPAAASLVAAGTFAITLVGRPIGAIVLGHFSDTIGRHRIAVFSAYGFAICTVLIALLPGVHQIGGWAVALLLTLRAIDGFFLGGEYTAATPLAIEESEPKGRGRTGGLIGSAFPAAYCLLALLVFVVLQIFPTGTLDSPYVQWGWRAMFIVGAVLALIFAIWYKTQVRESSAFVLAKKQHETTKTPLRVLFTGKSRRNFLQVFLLMTGAWLSANMLNAVLPALLIASAKLSPVTLTLVLVAANAVAVGTYMLSGVLSQRLGRRLMLGLGGVLVAVFAGASFAIVGTGTVTNPFVLFLLTVVAAATVGIAFGIVPSYINERFATGVRASGYGIAYSLSIVIPAFYAFYMLALSDIMPMQYTAAALAAIGGLLQLVGALLGPDTRNVRFPADDTDVVSAIPAPASVA
jgi:MFS family permease